jgi:hypothetical protein
MGASSRLDCCVQVYMRRWDFIVNGAVMRIEPQLRRDVISNGIALQVGAPAVLALPDTYVSHRPISPFAPTHLVLSCALGWLVLIW